MQKKRIVQVAVGTAGIALLAGACSSTSEESASPSPAATTAAPTPTETVATPTAVPTATATAAAGLPAPPAGSKELQNKNESGVQYARYSNSSKTPKEVNNFYKSAVEAEGFTVTQSDGGGGGWGGYGGSDYGLSAEKSGTYFEAQSGGETGKTTYFEVCLGSDKSAVDTCEKHSKDSNSGGS